MKQTAIIGMAAVGAVVGTAMVGVGLVGFMQDLPVWGMPIILGLLCLGCSAGTVSEMKG